MLRIFRFQRQQPRPRLQAVVSSVNKIPQENVVSVGQFASRHKEFFQIIKLAVDVATNGYRGGHRLNIGLLQKKIAHVVAQFL